MKFKYLLRGFGIGVLFSAIILALSYYNKPKGDLTEAEIISQARELGMMTEQDWKEKKIQETLDQMETDTVSKEAVDSASGQPSAEPESQPGEEQGKAEEDTNQETDKTKEDAMKEDSEAEEGPPKKEEESSKDETKSEEGDAPQDLEKPESEEPSDEDAGLAVIKVVSGMVSSEVAEDLENQGVIEDAYDFDAYMCDNGFAPLIQAGTFYVPKDASYLEIARILMRQ